MNSDLILKKNLKSYCELPSSFNLTIISWWIKISMEKWYTLLTTNMYVLMYYTTGVANGAVYNSEVGSFSSLNIRPPSDEEFSRVAAQC